MIQIKARHAPPDAISVPCGIPSPMFQPTCDLELAVIDKDGTHALVFPCR